MEGMRDCRKTRRYLLVGVAGEEVDRHQQGSLGFEPNHTGARRRLRPAIGRNLEVAATLEIDHGDQVGVVLDSESDSREPRHAAGREGCGDPPYMGYIGGGQVRDRIFAALEIEQGAVVDSGCVLHRWIRVDDEHTAFVRPRNGRPHEGAPQQPYTKDGNPSRTGKAGSSIQNELGIRQRSS